MSDKKLTKKVENSNSKKDTKNQKKTIRVKSDSVFKSIMSEEIAAREFLTEYLPENVKQVLDLSKITIDKDSYIQDDLTKKYSDIIYQVNTKDGGDAFIYAAIEHQSKPDPMMAFRLWKYALLLCERHIKKKGKLPLIVPLLVYNGKAKYNAARNLWDLFENPVLAKELLAGDYRLIDLHSMSNDEIRKKQHLGMLEFFMKNIKARDMLKVWEEFMENFSEILFLDKELGYIYIKRFLWYTSSVVAKENKQQLNNLILEKLNSKDGEEVMRTIADEYLEEGREAGIAEGMEKGILSTAKKMLLQSMDPKLISAVTGLTRDRILSLKSEL